MKKSYEKVFIEVPEKFSGIVMQKIGLRHTNLQNMNAHEAVATFEFIISTKEFFGYRSEFLTSSQIL